MSYVEKLEKMRYKSTESAKYNEIFSQIGDCASQKDIVSCYGQIQDFKTEFGGDSIDSVRLENSLKSKLYELKQANEQERLDIENHIKEIQADTISESEDVLNELDTKAQRELMNLLMKLKSMKTDSGVAYNKRFLGNYVQQGGRVEALAVSRLFLIPGFSEVITEKMKQTVSEKMQSPAVLAHEHAKSNLIAEQQRKLGKNFVAGFLLRKAEQKLFPNKKKIIEMEENENERNKHKHNHRRKQR